jgi:hypothetical protein
VLPDEGNNGMMIIRVKPKKLGENPASVPGESHKKLHGM